MATFVAKNSGGVKKKPMIILKEFFFRFSFINFRRMMQYKAFTVNPQTRNREKESIQHTSVTP